MNRTQLVEALTERTGLRRKDVDTVLRAFVDTVVETVTKGDDKVVVPGFAAFERVQHVERVGTNPATGERMTIPAHYAVKVSVGSTFKTKVRG